jgi:hypothetical protein
MLKLIALAVMVIGMVDVYLNSSIMATLGIFAVVSFLYLVINLLMNELAVQDE